MRVTWKDGVTTLATMGAAGLEWAYSHNWNLPLFSDIRWTIAGIAVLAAVAYVFSYLLDAERGHGWSVVANTLGVVTAGVTVLAFIMGTSGYVALLVLSVIVFWAASIVRHLTTPSPMTHSHV